MGNNKETSAFSKKVSYDLREYLHKIAPAGIASSATAQIPADKREGDGLRGPSAIGLRSRLADAV